MKYLAIILLLFISVSPLAFAETIMVCEGDQAKVEFYSGRLNEPLNRRIGSASYTFQDKLNISFICSESTDPDPKRTILCTGMSRENNDVVFSALLLMGVEDDSKDLFVLGVESHELSRMYGKCSLVDGFSKKIDPANGKVSIVPKELPSASTSAK